MKLDAEMLRKLALSGARSRLRELETEIERLREVVRQLTGATAPSDGRRKPAQAKPRKRRKYTDAFKRDVVREARAADSASEVGRKYNLPKNVVHAWIKKAEKK